jgi:hypothetical protein
VNPAINGWAIFKDKPIADDEAAAGEPEHSLSGRPQTSRRRLAMTRQAVGERRRAKYQGSDARFKLNLYLAGCKIETQSTAGCLRHEAI